MIFLIGEFIWILAIMIDEGSTIALYVLGYGSLESNPLISRFGTLITSFVMILVYLSIIILWKYVLYQYQKAHKEKQIAYRFTDVGVFIFCMFLIFASAGKITVGMHNIQIIEQISNSPQYRQAADNAVLTAEYLKQTAPDKYIAVMDKEYFSNKPFSWSLPEIYFFCILSFLLFKVGSIIKPSGVMI